MRASAFGAEMTPELTCLTRDVPEIARNGAVCSLVACVDLRVGGGRFLPKVGHLGTLLLWVGFPLSSILPGGGGGQTRAELGH